MTTTVKISCQNDQLIELLDNALTALANYPVEEPDLKAALLEKYEQTYSPGSVNQPTPNNTFEKFERENKPWYFYTPNSWIAYIKAL